MEVIALTGFQGSGKDTAAQALIQHHGFMAIAFADALKDAVAAIFCWPRDLIEGETGESRAWREVVDPWWAERLGIPDFTPRFALRHIGTGIMRQHFNPDLWLLNVERRCLSLGQGARIVITDARFPNELDLARRLNGRVYRVRRGPEPEWYNDAITANGPDLDVSRIAAVKALARDRLLHEYRVHESEWAWIGYAFDGIIENDGSRDDLLLKAAALVEARS
jgi:hypothetical protein